MTDLRTQIIVTDAEWEPIKKTPSWAPKKTGSDGIWVGNQQKVEALLKPGRYFDDRLSIEGLKDFYICSLGLRIRAPVPHTELVEADQNGVLDKSPESLNHGFVRCLSFKLSDKIMKAEDAYKHKEISQSTLARDGGKLAALFIFLMVNDRLAESNWVYDRQKKILYGVDMGSAFNTVHPDRIGDKTAIYGEDRKDLAWEEQIFPPAVLAAIRQDPRSFQEGIKAISEISDSELQDFSKNISSSLKLKSEKLQDSIDEMTSFAIYRKNNIARIADDFFNKLGQMELGESSNTIFVPNSFVSKYATQRVISDGERWGLEHGPSVMKCISHVVEAPKDIPDHITILWITGRQENGLPRRGIDNSDLQRLSHNLSVIGPKTSVCILTDDAFLVSENLKGRKKQHDEGSVVSSDINYISELSGYHKNDPTTIEFLDDYKNWRIRGLPRGKKTQSSIEAVGSKSEYLQPSRELVNRVRVKSLSDLFKEDEITIKENDPEFIKIDFFNDFTKKRRIQAPAFLSDHPQSYFLARDNAELVLRDCSGRIAGKFSVDDESPFVKLSIRKLDEQRWSNVSLEKKRKIEQAIICEASGSSPLRNPWTSADILKFVALKMHPGWLFDIQCKLTKPLPENAKAAHGILVVTNTDGGNDYLIMENGALAAPKNSKYVDKVLNEYGSLFLGKSKLLPSFLNRQVFKVLSIVLTSDFPYKINHIPLPLKASLEQRRFWSFNDAKRSSTSYYRGEYTNRLSTGVLWSTLSDHLKIKNKQAGQYGYAELFPADVKMPTDFFEMRPSRHLWKNRPLHPKAISKRSSAPQLRIRSIADPRRSPSPTPSARPEASQASSRPDDLRDFPPLGTSSEATSLGPILRIDDNQDTITHIPPLSQGTPAHISSEGSYSVSHEQAVKAARLEKGKAKGRGPRDAGK